LNYFFTFKGKQILLIILLLVVFSFFFIISKNLYTKNIINFSETENTMNNDILNPKFTLNNKKKLIKITAEEGNFISKSLIILKNNVLFNSDKFSISSNEVLFDNKNQTAKSTIKSEFLSKNTKIISEGFAITDKGNRIEFNGKTKLLINK
jgi:hypothetical protein